MDIKRTILWIVFSMSLLILWDNWMRHNGKPSMFSPSVTQQNKPVATGSATTPVPQAAALAGNSQSPAEVAAAVAGTAALKSEIVTITTDVVKAQINTAGGELQYLELLKHKDTVDPTKNLVLFNAAAGHTYLAQSGLIGGAFPNHKSAFVVQPGARELGAGNEVKLVLESEAGGVKLIKTFTFKRGDYNIDIRHDIANASGTPVAPSLYLQLVRDGNKPGGESKFYSTFTGPAVYTDAEKFQKLDFAKIADGKSRIA